MLYGQVVSLGITPEYFLDKMSLDEVIALIRGSNRNLYERERLQCFFNLIAQGTDIKKPTDIIKFEWEEKPKKEVKKLTKDQLQQRADKVKKYINMTKVIK